VSFNIADGAGMEALVDVNEDVLGNIQLGEAEELWFKSSDGLDAQNWLIKPPDC
jgi:dipeptidyl aminopeptidase/acylaminoacyl peptidase